MVRIADNKLIIEIPCPGRNPLEQLAEYQMGIVGALHAYAYADMSGIPVNGDLSFETTIHRLTFLLNELMVKNDQSREVGKAILSNKKALQALNELCDRGE